MTPLRQSAQWRGVNGIVAALLTITATTKRGAG
jgi:hypothetical protein